MHDPEHGSEELLEVHARPRLNPDPDAGTKEPVGKLGPEIQRLGRDEPLLALVEGRQRPLQLAAGRFDHRPHLGARIGRWSYPQRGRGIHELPREALRAPDRADEYRERCCGTLLPRVPEGTLDEIGCREVEVRGRHDDHGVLAARFSEQRQVGAPGAEQGCGLERAGQDDAVDIRMRDQLLPEATLVNVNQGEDVPGNAGLPEGLSHHRSATSRLRRRFEDHARARGERGQHAARGNSDGKVPWWGDHRQARGHEHRTADPIELPCCRGIVVREVDSLAHLDIRLSEDLARLGSSDLDQFAAPGFQCPRRGLQHCRSVGRRHRAPPRCRVADSGDDFLKPIGIRDPRCLDRRIPCRRHRHALEHVPRPLAVRRERRVGVTRVAEPRRARGYTVRLGRGVDRRLDVFDTTEAGDAIVGCRGTRDPKHGLCQATGLRQRSVAKDAGLGSAVSGLLRFPVLSAVGAGRQPRLSGALERRDEAIPLPLEQRRVVGQIERRRQEVLTRRVFFESAHQVADRNIELLRVHNRHVQEHVSDLARDRRDLPLRHAQEHLDLDVFAHASLAGQQPRVGDVEDVVPGDAEPHGIRILRLQRLVEAAQVVGVGVELAVVGRQGPVVHDRVHPLHREVGALDKPDLDASAAARDALARPGRELPQRGERIGQISLQHDPRLEVAQPLILKEASEHRDRQVEVAVLLHVEVDEGAAAVLRQPRRGGEVQRSEALDDGIHKLIEGPHRDVARDRRDLHRDVVDIGATDEVVDALEPAQRLAFAENSFTQQIEVQFRAALAQRCDRRPELFGARVDDEVRNHLAQGAAGDWHDRRREHGSHRPANLHGTPEVPGQKLRCERRDARERGCCGGETLGPHDTVDEADRERQTVRIFQDSGEALGRGIRGELGGFGNPACGEIDRARRQVARRRGWRRVGGLLHAISLRPAGPRKRLRGAVFSGRG